MRKGIELSTCYLKRWNKGGHKSVPSEGDKDGSLCRPIYTITHLYYLRKIQQGCGESLNQCHVTEGSCISQEQGCLGVPVALSESLGCTCGRCSQYKRSDGFQSSTGSVMANYSLCSWKPK